MMIFAMVVYMAMMGFVALSVLFAVAWQAGGPLSLIVLPALIFAVIVTIGAARQVWLDRKDFS